MMINKNFKFFNFILFLFICVCICSFPVYAENIVVVIDPGHGGDSTGGSMDDRIEREIDLITATAMKERLEQYNDVDVYLTRTNNDDKELSREQRFQFAENVNADYFFSIHYNMSEYHTLYGSEVWVCSSGDFYKFGASFAQIELEALSSLGLFNRGTKCRLDEKGQEYYGILKYSKEYNIPAVLIEHCHLDEERDSAFWNEDAYIKFGEIDADNVAKYLSLKSDSLSIDYSNYERPVIESDFILPDKTPPEYCNISLIDSNDLTATINIESFDSDTYIQYYSYSLDGGANWSRLEAWDNRDQDNMSFEVDLLENKEAALVVKTYNQYDLDLMSEILILPSKTIIEEAVVEESENIREIYITPIEPAKDNTFNDYINNIAKHIKNINLLTVIILILVIGTTLLTLGTIIYLIAFMQPKKEKNKKDEN